jgi:hypothetical protein
MASAFALANGLLVVSELMMAGFPRWTWRRILLARSRWTLRHRFSPFAVDLASHFCVECWTLHRVSATPIHCPWSPNLTPCESYTNARISSGLAPNP